MSNNRLNAFTIEELHAMFKGSSSSFTGWTQLDISLANTLIDKFHGELGVEIAKRKKKLDDEIERTTPRCECCKQRLES